MNDRIRTLHALEQEVGILMRRVRRALSERAALVHPSLQPSSYVMLAHQVAGETARGLARLGIEGGAAGGGRIPDLATLPEPVRVVVEHAFGVATGHLFLVSAPFAVAALVAVLFIKEVPMRDTLEDDDLGAAQRAPEATGALER